MLNKKIVNKELKNCVKEKQAILHKTLKMFLKIQTFDNKNLSQKQRRAKRLAYCSDDENIV